MLLPELIVPALAVAVGLVLLVWSADRFIAGASGLAAQLGVEPLVIGMLIVGFGTSAPELLVSTAAALDDNPGIAVGNAIGSNIANIALILGATALLQPIAVHSRVVNRELPALLVVTMVLVLLVADAHLGRLDGSLLLLGLIGLIGFTYWEAHHARDDVLATQYGSVEVDETTGRSLKAALLWLLAGLLVLMLSSRMLVWGAAGLARSFGVSDLVIGLTVIAIGTSLPELAAGIAAARKGEADIAVGNVVGSNMFNTLGVLGIPGVLAPTLLEPAVLYRDLPIMTGLTLMLFALMWHRRNRGARIGRAQGAILLGFFAAYQALLFTRLSG